jgi:hypothetical protein
MNQTPQQHVRGECGDVHLAKDQGMGLSFVLAGRGAGTQPHKALDVNAEAFPTLCT